MNGHPLSSLLSSVEQHRLQTMEFGLGAAYRTIVEIYAFYDRMAGCDEFERLDDVVKWLAGALGELYGTEKVGAWEAEAKSPEYSPFAQA